MQSDNDIKLEVQNSSQNSIEEQDKNLQKLVQKIGSIKLEQSNVIQTLHTIMETVEIIDKNLKGSNKKDLVLKGIKWLANNQLLSETDKLILNSVIDQVVPPAIDLIIDVSKGVSNLVQKTGSSCLKCFN